MVKYLVGFLIIIGFSSCKINYAISDFEEVSYDHEEVAILPFEVIMFDKKNESKPLDEIENEEEFLSLTLQAAFYDRLIKSTKQGRKPLRVNIQRPSETLSLLEENGIDVRNSWYKDPVELAEILNVDAVLCCKIEREKTFSDVKSFGIDALTFTINLTSFFFGGGALINADSTNKFIFTIYELVEGEEGFVLWSTNFNQTGNWTVDLDYVVERMHNHCAKNFPYRVDPK